MRRNDSRLIADAERVERLGAAWRMVAQSDCDPMMTATGVAAFVNDASGGLKRWKRCPGIAEAVHRRKRGFGGLGG